MVTIGANLEGDKAQISEREKKRGNTRTHFELGFSVNASITLGRMAMEQQGEKVSATELFNNLFTHLQNAAVTGCKRGKKVGLGDQVAWRTTMKTKKRRSRVTAWKQFQSQVQECASTFPSG